MSEHTLKTWPTHFHEVLAGRKTFELRKDDRGYQPGDTLVLAEWDPDTERYTGRRCTAAVSHLLRGGQFGLEDGYVCMSLRRTP